MFGKIYTNGKMDIVVTRINQKAPLSWRLKNMIRWGYIQGWLSVLIAHVISRYLAITSVVAQLSIKIIRSDGIVVDYGVVSRRVVTTAGVGYIVDAFQGLVEPENMRYHGLGTGSTAEDASDTALVTELTTEYTGNVRATGTLTEGASANIFRTVGTNTLDETPGAALREHGLFSQAAPGGGVLLDRSVFAAITLSDGDSIQTTYDVTFTAGS